VSRVIGIILLLTYQVALGQSLDDQIKAKQKQIAALQSQLDPKVTPLLVDSNLRFFVSNTVLDLIWTEYDQQPNKTFHYHETLQEGQLVNSNGGLLGCGYYAELQGATGDVSVPQISSSYQSNGTIALQTSFNAEVQGQVLAHVKGPPGPCSILHPLPTCDCQLGGGFGTSAHLDAQKGSPLGAIVTFTANSGSWLNYDVGSLTPSGLDVTISISLQYIGSIGIPTHFDLPQSSVLHGSAPNVFQGNGTVAVGPPVNFSKSYNVTVTPSAVVADAKGYAAKAAATISWSP
jgi:hypothetical protein